MYRPIGIVGFGIVLLKTEKVLNVTPGSDYSVEQLKCLDITLDRAQEILLSLFCVAESANLIKSSHQRRLQAKAASLCNTRREAITEILQHPSFPQLGVADVCLLLAGNSDTCTLTADREIFEALCKIEHTAIHFGAEPRKLYIVSCPD